MPTDAKTIAPPKPAIIDGWVLRRVFNGEVALLESRHGMIEIEAGDSLPGVGRVQEIKRQDGRWVVVTAKGMILPGIEDGHDQAAATVVVVASRPSEPSAPPWRATLSRRSGRYGRRPKARAVTADPGMPINCHRHHARDPRHRGPVPPFPRSASGATTHGCTHRGGPGGGSLRRITSQNSRKVPRWAAAM